MEGYKTEIVRSSKELTGKEKLIFKDLSNAVKLDSVVSSDSPLIISPVDYAIIAVHNEKSENPDYNNYVIVDSSGKKYVTGSPSFWQAFSDIWDAMSDEDEEYSIEIYKMDSKNYKGKQFLTCSIV